MIQITTYQALMLVASLLGFFYNVGLATILLLMTVQQATGKKFKL